MGWGWPATPVETWGWFSHPRRPNHFFFWVFFGFGPMGWFSHPQGPIEGDFIVGKKNLGTKKFLRVYPKCLDIISLKREVISDVKVGMLDMHTNYIYTIINNCPLFI